MQYMQEQVHKGNVVMATVNKAVNDAPIRYINDHFGTGYDGDIEIELEVDALYVTIQTVKPLFINACIADAESRGLQYCSLKAFTAPDPVTEKRRLLYTAEAVDKGVV